MKYPCGIVLIGCEVHTETTVPVVRSFLFADTVLIRRGVRHAFRLHCGQDLAWPTRIDLAVTTGPCIFRALSVGNRTCPLGMYSKFAQLNATCGVGEVIGVDIECDPSLFMLDEPTERGGP
jgi:hypothetical protein